MKINIFNATTQKREQLATVKTPEEVFDFIERFKEQHKKYSDYRIAPYNRMMQDTEKDNRKITIDFGDYSNFLEVTATKREYKILNDVWNYRK